MSALDRLEALLHTGWTQSLSRPWAVDTSIDSPIARMERRLRAGTTPYVPRDLQEAALRRFWDSRRLANLKEARLVSFGVAVPVGPRRLRVIEDRERFPALLEGVDRFLPTPRQYRRCYQGLLSGFFGYDPEAEGQPAAGRDNWGQLRSYLREQSDRVRIDDRDPQWTVTLQGHGTLFGPDPCARYGAPLLAGDHAEVDELRDVLGISDSSWFMRKLFLGQIHAAVGYRDRVFLGLLERLLAVLQENALVRDEGLALVLDRYARIEPRTLAAPLRDAAVGWWGNPWLQSNAMRWGRVTPEARAMVTEWLKLEFIETFFTLLAEEGSGDRRRLKFWSRYVHAIEDIHFALGSGARANPSPDFQVLRKKMAGLVVPLTDSVKSNNAFIMRMGRLVLVEFSGYSNASYGYDAESDLPFRFDMPVVLPVDEKNSLKHSDRALYLRHQDYVHGYATWEDRFEADLATDHGIKPKAATDRPVPVVRSAQTRAARPPVRALASSLQRPVEASRPPTRDFTGWMTVNYSRQALSRFADRYGLRIEDMTPSNGNLWVRTDDSRPAINEALEAWGFEFRNATKGWWKSR